MENKLRQRIRKSISFKNTVSKTRPEFRDSTDINKLMKKYVATGELPQSTRVAQFMDVSGIQSFQDAQMTVMTAHETFDNLSSAIRKKFKNDPVQLLGYLADEKNLEESYELGLRERPVVKKEIVYKEHEKQKNTDVNKDTIKPE